MTYVYRPLDCSRREIRLIELVNLDEILSVTETIESDPILHRDPDRVRSVEDNFSVRCVISHVSLEDKPTYVALSYTVGDLFKALFSVLSHVNFSVPIAAPETCQISPALLSCRREVC